VECSRRLFFPARASCSAAVCFSVLTSGSACTPARFDFVRISVQFRRHRATVPRASVRSKQAFVFWLRSPDPTHRFYFKASRFARCLVPLPSPGRIFSVADFSVRRQALRPRFCSRAVRAGGTDARFFLLPSNLHCATMNPGWPFDLRVALEFLAAGVKPISSLMCSSRRICL
jgi:hypothetical protein